MRATLDYSLILLCTNDQGIFVPLEISDLILLYCSREVPAILRLSIDSCTYPDKTIYFVMKCGTNYYSYWFTRILMKMLWKKSKNTLRKLCYNITLPDPYLGSNRESEMHRETQKVLARFLGKDCSLETLVEILNQSQYNPEEIRIAVEICLAIESIQ